jgi:hypothetical protein
MNNSNEQIADKSGILFIGNVCPQHIALRDIDVYLPSRGTTITRDSNTT